MRHRRVRVFLCLSPEFVGAEDKVFVLGRIDQRFDDHRPTSLESLGQGVMHLCDRTHSASQARQSNGSVADRGQARGACHSTESPDVLV